jgi:hypothetical protein
MIFGGVGAALLLLGALVFSLSGSDGKAQAVEASPSPTVRGDVTAWFEGTAEIRGEVMSASTAVRTYVEDNDGLALQPACITLGEQAAIAKSHANAPDADLQILWAGGATKFAEAAGWCAKLWDGTPMAPTAILAQVTGALDSAEASWAELAKLAGQPLPDLPSGTFDPMEGRSGSSSQRSGSTSATPAAAPRVTPTPTTEPESGFPSITLPTFDQPSPSAVAPSGIPTTTPADG